MYQNLIPQFHQLSILVIGDLMLDVYLKGISTRLSPEAPVPVVDILTDTTVLGGAANTATNLRSLGAKVTFCSVSGMDSNGNKAIELLEKLEITPRILQYNTRNTIVKTRVVADNQLLIRYDTGNETPVTAEMEDAFILLLQQLYMEHDAIVIADYNKGLLTTAVVRALQILGSEKKKFIAIDSSRLEYFKSLSPTLVKPNYQEFIKLLGLTSRPSNKMKQVSDYGKEIFQYTGAAITAVTLDEEGALIFEGADLMYRCRAHPVSSPQVSGAGDAYISAFTLAALAGADISAAAELSAAVAAVAISKKITANCSYEELKAYLSINEKYIADLQQLEHIVNMYKEQGKKIVFTNGCFDILHSGHVSYLNRTRDLGHVLIVGINTDESIRRIKGSKRPINQLYDRMEVLAGLGSVNHIIAFGSIEDDTPVSLIKVIRPHIVTKGGDYTKEALPEAGIIEQLGGEIILLPLLPDRSTTLILDRIHNSQPLKTI